VTKKLNKDRKKERIKERSKQKKEIEGINGRNKDVALCKFRVSADGASTTGTQLPARLRN
jgi:hypothetical protein